MSGLVHYFLKHSFAQRFFEQNIVLQDLSEFTISKCKIRPVKLSKRNGKSVIEFGLQILSKSNRQHLSKSIVGEFRPDDRGEYVFNLLQELRLNGFDADNPLKVCEPVAYFPEWNLLIRSKANGVQLSKMLARSDGSLKSYLMWAAKWLAKLHRTRVTHTRRFSMKEEEEILDSWARRLDLRPSLRGNVGNMKNRIVERIRPVHPESFTLIHGDFHPKNIFVDHVSLTAIDFDHSCIFDPAKDLGYFIAELFVQRALKKRRYETALEAVGLRQHFVSEYAGRMSREFLDRVASYEASSYLEHLNYRVLMGEFDLLDFRHWLCEAEKCLQRMS